MKNQICIVKNIAEGMIGIGGVPTNEEFYAEFDMRIRAALEQEPTAMEQIREAFEPIQQESKGTELHPVDLEQISLKHSSKHDFTMTDKIEDYPVYDEKYLNECIKKAAPALSKIKDVDKDLDELRGVEQESKENKKVDVFLIHRDGNTTRLYKNGKKVSPAEFTELYGCEMTEEQKKILKVVKEAEQESKKKPDLNNIVFGPGDDNYGKNIPHWKEQPIHTAKEWGRIRKFAKDQFKRGQEYAQQSRRAELIKLVQEARKGSHVSGITSTTFWRFDVDCASKIIDNYLKLKT